MPQRSNSSVQGMFWLEQAQSTQHAKETNVPQWSGHTGGFLDYLTVVLFDREERFWCWDSDKDFQKLHHKVNHLGWLSWSQTGDLQAIGSPNPGLVCFNVGQHNAVSWIRFQHSKNQLSHNHQNSYLHLRNQKHSNTKTIFLIKNVNWSCIELIV